MSRIMQPARTPSGAAFDVQYMQYVSGATFARGAVLAYTSGEVNEAGANPATIVGVALQAADTSPGFAAANNPSPITGRSRKVSVARANDVTVFSATLTNGSSTRIAPTVADIGTQVGITAYSGVWTVDKNKTAGNARVAIVGIDTDVNVVFFRFLSANQAD